MGGSTTGSASRAFFFARITPFLLLDDFVPPPSPPPNSLTNSLQIPKKTFSASLLTPGFFCRSDLSFIRSISSLFAGLPGWRPPIRALCMNLVFHLCSFFHGGAIVALASFSPGRNISLLFCFRLVQIQTYRLPTALLCCIWLRL